MDLDFFSYLFDHTYMHVELFLENLCPLNSIIWSWMWKMLTGFFLMKKEFEGLQNKVKPFRILKKKQHRNKRHVLMEFI